MSAKFEMKNTLKPGLEAFNKKLAMGKKTGKDFKIRADVGLQAINWIVNGSSRESVVPPIKDGILRGSGSVFVGSAFVGDTKKKYPKGQPNYSHSENPDTITWGFDAWYTSLLHEKPFSETKAKGYWSPGPTSKQSGDVGNKFIEKHLKADGPNLLKFYSKLFQKEMGT